MDGGGEAFQRVMGGDHPGVDGGDMGGGSLIRISCILADFELIPSTTQPISIWSHWKNKNIVM